MSDFCRLCGVFKDLYDFSELSDSELLIEFKLKSCFNISLTSDKLMPQNVCSECVQCLEKSFQFHQNILNVQEELVQSIKHNVKQEVLDSNMECVVLLEQIPIELLGRSTRKIVEKPIVKNTRIKDGKIVKVKKVKISVPTQKPIKKPKIIRAPILSMEELYKNELNGIFQQAPETFDGDEDIMNSIVWSKYIWKCDNCDQQFNHITLLKQHHSESHSNQTLQYCCFSCPKICYTRHSIINHIITHQPSLRFCCVYCSKYHTSFIDLYHHYTQNHPTVKIFLCLYCGIYSKNGSSARNHHIKHFIEANLSCDLCGKAFKFLTNLRYHIQAMHIIDLSTNFTCEICGTSFKNRPCLTSHKKTHIIIKKFNCNICGNQFTTMSALRKHTKSHLKIKDHVCSVCGRAFARKSVLDNHKRTHEDRYDYECELCDKKYKYYDSLKIHRYTHTGETISQKP